MARSEHFFLNYGGLSSFWSEDPLITMNLHQECINFYGQPIRFREYKVKGLDLTVCTYGIHRALLVQLPENASKETSDLFEIIKENAAEFCWSEYELLNNNCVTSVANILNLIDKNMTPKKVVFPWSLDQHLKKYCGSYEQGTSMAAFIEKYQEKVQRQRFTLLRRHHWAETKVETAQDIIAHAYGKTGGTGERTKSTLLELGWVTEDKNHLLRPTQKAPADFREGLAEYNLDLEKVQKLKQLYKREASIFSRHARDFFNDNPDYETVIKRLEAQAKMNPKGASATVLFNFFQAKTQSFKEMHEALRDEIEPKSAPGPSIK